MLLGIVRAYQKFTRILNKAIIVANSKGMKTTDHYNQTVEMVKLGSGTLRKVENSRMAELYDVDIRTVNHHLAQIFESGELQESATIQKNGIVQMEGNSEVNRPQMLYNIDVIIVPSIIV